MYEECLIHLRRLLQMLEEEYTDIAHSLQGGAAGRLPQRPDRGNGSLAGIHTIAAKSQYIIRRK